METRLSTANSYIGKNVIRENNSITENTAVSKLKGMLEGTVFSGEITDITGNLVKLDLGKGALLSALLEDSVSFNIGEKASFEVLKNDGMKILLKALESSGNPLDSLFKSLDSIGIPANRSNAQLLSEMMKNGMPINKDAVNEMIKTVKAFGDTPIDTLVSMKNHNIPINAENIEQFTDYKNYEHKISEGVKGLADNIVDMVKTAMLEGNTKEASDILQKFAQVFDVQLDNEVEVPANMQANTQVAAQENAYANTQANSQENAQVNANVNTQENVQTNVQVDSNLNNQSNTPVDAQANTQIQQELVNNENQTKSVDTKNSDTIELLNAQNLDKNLEKIEKHIKEKYLLEPEKLLSELSKNNQVGEKIKDMYSQMYKEATKLLDVLKDSGMVDSKVYKSAESIKNNISFMSDLNHLAAYVQIPIKTMSGEAHSELYVYNRKKTNFKENEQVTAFLHLDMEHLGATDVNISLNNGKVTTKFTLEDLKSQEIVEEHLPDLQKRLEKLGYSAVITVETIENGEKETPFEKLLEVDKPKMSVKRYSFDVKM